MKHLYFMPRGHPRIIYAVVRWSSLRRYATTGAIICFLLLFWWFFYIRPLYKRACHKQQLLLQARQEQEEIVNLQKKIQDTQRELNNIKQQFAVLTPANFVAEWISAAHNSGLSLLTARSFKPEALQASSLPYSLEKIEQIEPDFLFVELTVQGSFNAFEEFMSKTDFLAYPVNLKSCTIKRCHDELANYSFVYKFYL